jgi:proline racemase
LKYFFDESIPKDFYSKIIFGYVGLKKNIEIKNNNNNNLVYMDNIIIERVNRHLNFNADIPNQMKQIEFICVYKNKNNKNNNITNNANINTNNKNKKYDINTIKGQ